jgi:alpha-glucosidase
MQWDMSPNAGFSQVRPWLPLAASWTDCNVVVEAADPGSLLSFYRALLQLRRTYRPLALGSFSLVEVRGDLLAYRRTFNGEHLFVALNFGASEQTIQMAGTGQVLLSTSGGRGGHDDIGASLVLHPHEGVICALD